MKIKKGEVYEVYDFPVTHIRIDNIFKKVVKEGFLWWRKYKEYTYVRYTHHTGIRYSYYRIEIWGDIELKALEKKIIRKHIY